MSSNIELEVKELIKDKLGIEKDKILLESSFVEDFKTDSLDMVELVLEGEKKFGVRIPDDEASKIKTVKDLVDYIERYRDNESKMNPTN